MDTQLIMNYLSNTNEKIIHRSKIESVLNKAMNINTFDDILFNLRRSNRIKYIFKGYYYILSSDELSNKYYEYSINEMIFVILNKMNVKWYVGLQSSLEYNKLVWQAYNVLIILNNKFSREITVDGNRIKFRKIKDDYMFGFKDQKTKNRVTLYYSDIEKSIIDFAYFKIKVPLELLKDYDDMKLKEYLKNYSKLIKKRVMFNEY